MQFTTSFQLFAAVLVAFATASAAVVDGNLKFHGNEDTTVRRARRDRPCIVGCNVVVHGNNLVVDNTGIRSSNQRRVGTNEGSWEPSSGREDSRIYAIYSPNEGSRRTVGDAIADASDQGSSGDSYSGQNGGHAQPNDVKISRPCIGCGLVIRGTGNIVRN